MNLHIALGLSVALAALASDAQAQTVSGFRVEPYATVSNPVRISIDTNNVLFAGRNPPASQSGATSIWRIERGGSPVAQSPNFSDPDAVIVDSRGLISGVSGSVLVGGTIGNGQFRIAAWGPDGATRNVLDYGGIDINGFAFDPDGRLIIAADAAVYRFDGSQVVGLFSPASRAQSVAVDSGGNFYVALENGNLAVYGSMGQLINNRLANFNNAFQIIVTNEGQFGAGVFALDSSLWRVQNDGTKISLGTGFVPGSSMAFGPDGSLYVSEFATNRIMRIACKPLLSSQPQSQSACKGSSVVLTVAAASTGLFTYHWRKDAIPLDTIANPSAATATLTLTNVQAADAGSYDCVVSNDCGSVTSNAADLDVYCDCPAYSVTAGSIDNFALPADPATRSASFTDALNNQNPRAFLKFDEMPGVTAGTVGDQNIAQSFTNVPSDLISATLTFRAKSGPDTNPGAEGTDRMRLGFASGSGNNAAFDIRWERFFGTGNATDAFLPGVTWGGSIDRTIALNLAALPKASQQGGGTVNVLPEMIASQTLDFVVDDDSAVDYMQLTGVRNGNGQKVAWVRSHPTDQYACLANTESFSVTAAGTGPFTYEWRKDGVAIDTLANPSAATATFTLTNVQTSDAGSYDCIVTGTCGSVTSNAATLTVCTGDINCDEGVDFGDFLAFFNCYDAEQSCADIDGNPGVDFGDFLSFFNAYDTGC
jgi:hypothetical protein